MSASNVPRGFSFGTGRGSRVHEPNTPREKEPAVLAKPPLLEEALDPCTRPPHTGSSRDSEEAASLLLH